MIKPKKNRNLKFQDGKWYLDFTFRGIRIRQFGGYTKEQARNTLARIRIEKLDEKLGFKKPGSKDPILFKDFADDILETYCKQNKRSWDWDEISLANLDRYFKGETLQSIGPEKVERFKANRRTEVSPATVNRELACLKTLFNKSVEWGKIETNPLRSIKKFKENNVREQILNGAEAKRLIESAGSTIKPIFIIALNTGMRRNEILSLKWHNVDFARGFIFIEDSKSGKSRKIPMDSAVLEAFKQQPKSAEFVFFNPETKPISSTSPQGSSWHEIKPG